MAANFAFDRFVLDTADRRLRADGQPVELNGRYFDALALLVRDCGKLVPKDHFLDQVWRGVPVTDEALTQCIKTLRRKLGDDANRPRFIETVPKHGYRFIAPVEMVEERNFAEFRAAAADARRWREFVATTSAGIAGGGAAGIGGGLVYGFAGASAPLGAGPGALSVLLVLLSVTLLVALIGAAGVSVGIAVAWLARPGSVVWSTIGGAGGGLLVGAFGKLLGLDAFTLLAGHAPGNITGALEGMLLGGAVGMAAWVAKRSASFSRGTALAALFGASAGLVISLFGGRLMLGSLDLLARHVPDSRLHLDQISRFFGEASFGPVTRTVTSALEGALFAAGLVAGMLVGRRHRASD